jgi:peptidoglycan hydrolase-like protein with peptidoglycan-binding domain
MELVAYLHSEVLCERLQQGESIDQTLDCQLLDSIAQSSRHAKSVLCVGLAASAIAINAMPIAAFAYTPEVASIQQLLARRGFNPGAIDGVKGAATTEAIVAAQTFYKLKADGAIGAQTIAALEADTYEANISLKDTPVKVTPVANSANKSDSVKNLQQLLSDRGFYGGAIDGISGPMTKEAIILAQKTYGLVADGVAGSLTMAALESGSNYVPKSNVASTKSDSIKNLQLANSANKSDSVKNLQQLLSDRGFYGGAIDGISGPMTKEAIILAQKTYGLVADGVAGSLTMAALESGSNYVPKSNVASTKSDSIKNLQQLLSDRGFYGGAIDGINGPMTQEAIILAQKTYGLVTDGVAGSLTMAALESGSTITISYKEAAGQETTSNATDNSIKKGQTLLSQLGLYDGAIDGIQGSKTTAAIKKAQTLYGLPVDGVLNSATLAALKS